MEIQEVMVFVNTPLGQVALSISILFFTVLFERLIARTLMNAFERSSLKLNVDKTQYILFKHALTALIYAVGIGIAIFMIPSLRTLSVSLFAGAGVLAIVVGFASQKAVADLIAGLFIAIWKPFRVGDTIKFADRLGEVEDINLRHTTIRNFENKRFIVPNSLINREIIENYNIEDEKICRFVDIGISYDSDINKAMKIMQEEAMKNPRFRDHRTKSEKEANVSPVKVRVISFGDSSVNLRAWVWADNPSAAYNLGCELNKSIKERFDKEGIEIPFPYRTVVFKDKEKKKRQPKRKKK